MGEGLGLPSTGWKGQRAREQRLGSHTRTQGLGKKRKNVG